VSPKTGYDLAQKGYTIASIRSGMVTLVPDGANKDSPFANKAVREAVEYAIDREGIVKAIGYGYWVPALQGCIVDWPAYNPDVKGRPYNVEKAKQLLKDAGYANGFKTTITMPSNIANKDASVLFQSYLKAVNIEANIDVIDAGQWAKVKAEGWKNGLVYSSTYIMNGNFVANVANQLTPDSSQYASMAKPAGYGDLIKQGFAATDNATLTKLSQSLVKYMSEEALFMPLWAANTFAAKQKYVNGDNHALFYVLGWTPATAWLNK
jgi:peptide/nickel transport system substrate-binding protein